MPYILFLLLHSPSIPFTFQYYIHRGGREDVKMQFDALLP
jgi:hypothetical protein